MNSYMSSFINNGISENQFNAFVQDTAVLVQGYLNGGMRLVTWIQTVNGNGVNYTTSGFATKNYRGTLLPNRSYDRQLSILDIITDVL